MPPRLSLSVRDILRCHILIGMTETIRRAGGKTPDRETSSLAPWLIAAVVLCIIPVVWLCIDWFVATDSASLGQRGDAIGGHLAGGFSLAANVLFVGALFMQRRELQHQREELSLQRAESAANRAVSEQQAATLQLQAHLAEKTAALQALHEMLRLRSSLTLRGSEVAVSHLDHPVLDEIKRQLEYMSPYILNTMACAAISNDERQVLFRAFAPWTRTADSAPNDFFVLTPVWEKQSSTGESKAR